MGYGKYNDSSKITELDKVSRKYDGYQKGLASIVCKFIDKKSKGRDIKFMLNQHLVDELHNSIVRNF